MTVFGIHAVLATLQNMPQRARKLLLQAQSPQLAAIESLAKQRRLPISIVGKHELTNLAEGESAHQGVVLLTDPFPYMDLDDALQKKPNLVVVLDGVEDPRNLGRAARSAYAFGADLLVIPKDRAAQVTGAAEKAAVGALAKLPVVQVTNLRRALDDLKDHDIWLIGAEAGAKTMAWQHDFNLPTAMVIGAEDKGLRRLIREGCDLLVNIPMTRGEMSLNAADAATVLLYEASRQRALQKGK